MLPGSDSSIASWMLSPGLTVIKEMLELLKREIVSLPVWLESEDAGDTIKFNEIININLIIRFPYAEGMEYNIT